MSSRRQSLSCRSGRGRDATRPRSWRVALVCTFAGFALGLGSGASAASTGSAAASPTLPPAASPPLQGVVTIRPEVHGRPVAPSFVGLSLEYRTLLDYAGSDPGAVNPVFIRLLWNLAPGQPAVLRIGGDSTDWTWWPVPKMKRPPGVTYDITQTWLEVARALAHASGASYILGINLEAASEAIETAEARAFLNGIGRSHIQALELGNEPELYSKLGWYRSGTRFVRGRPASYDFQGFTTEVSDFRKVISPVLIAGPSTGSFWWLTHLTQFLAAEPSLGLVTVHSYWLNKCLSYPGLAGFPTIAHLLTPFPPSRLAGALARYAALAHARGVPIRIDEMNSVTCGGQNGVSDVFASALWSLNALFEAASDGVDGVNLHTFPGTANQLFGFTRVGGHWAATVRPEYYGLLMFAQAAPPGSKLLKIIQQNTGQTRAWATQGHDGNTRVLLINDSLTQARSVLVRVSAPGGPAQLGRLTAPSAAATSGITLDGQSFGPQTLTGTLPGTSSTISMPAPSGPGPISAYVVPLPAASAALLTISPGAKASARR
jgi:hypothetical protein